MRPTVIQVGKGKTITMTQEEIGKEIIQAIISDIGTTKGQTKKIRYILDLDISVDETTEETKIRSIVLRPRASRSNESQESPEEIKSFQEELDKL